MLLTGVMDGCSWCEHHRSRWNDPAAIQDGFLITRSMEGLHTLWEKLDKNRNGELIRRDGDFSVRKGLCHKPLSIRDLFHFTICHKVPKYFGLDQSPSMILRLFLLFQACSPSTILRLFLLFQAWSLGKRILIKKELEFEWWSCTNKFCFWHKTLFQWMHFLNHKIKILLHLMVDHLDWNQYKHVMPSLKAAKCRVQAALKPGGGGDGSSNIGIEFKISFSSYCFFWKVLHTTSLTVVGMVATLPQLRPVGRFTGRQSSGKDW